MTGRYTGSATSAGYWVSPLGQDESPAGQGLEEAARGILLGDPWCMTKGCAGRIVVGYDDSEASKAALAWASLEAVRRDRGVTLLNAIMAPVTSNSFGVSLPAPLEMLQELTDAARRALDDIAQTLEVPRGAVATIEVGSPSGVLIEASTEAALIVMGSRGRGGFSGLLLGSVGDQVSSHARCPVVVVRGEVPPDATTIVVGVDGSPNSEAALAFAFETASRNGASVCAVHAWQIPNYELLVVSGTADDVGIPELEESEIRLSSEVLAGMRLDFPDVVIDERVVQKDAATALLTASPNPALIVVGSHGHGAISRALLGSVSRAVLHRAHVPVAVIPERKP